jgi:hypothetical protein
VERHHSSHHGRRPVAAAGGGRAALGGACRALAAALAIVLAALAAPRASGAQVLERTVRLAITEVSDTTFAFDAANLRWVKPGEIGMAVDPRRRDALVARFTILGVERGKATALVTGQTTQLTLDHVVVLEIPIRPWYRSSLFWSGTVLGVLAGALVGSR